MKVAKVAFQKNVKYIPKKIKLAHQERQGQHESEIFRGDGDRKLYTSFVSQPAGMSIITQEDQDKFCELLGSVNIMHDKRVYRGSNFTKPPKKDAKESPAAREAEVRRRSMARKKAMDNETRALRLHLKAPKYTVRGRPYVEYQHGNTNLIELFDLPQQSTQTADFDQELLLYPGVGTYTGIDAFTQVNEKDLFDFDTEVIPIAEAQITDVFKQATLEIIYEDELDARARQHRSLYLRRTLEEIEAQRLEHEDKWLNRVIAYHSKLFDQKSQSLELTSGRIVNLLPKVLSDNTLPSNTIEYPEIVTWIMERLQTGTAIKHVDISDDILKNMIYELVKHRSETCNDEYDIKNIQKSEDSVEEYYSITSQNDAYMDAYNEQEDG